MRIETTQTDREFYMCGVQFIPSPWLQRSPILFQMLIPMMKMTGLDGCMDVVVNDWWKEACVFGKVLFAQFSNCMWFVTHFNDSMNGTARHAISIPSQPCISSNLVWFPSRSENWLSSGLDWPLWKATSTTVEYTWNVFKMITIIFIVVRIGISISITINIWSNSDQRLERP